MKTIKHNIQTLNKGILMSFVLLFIVSMVTMLFQSGFYPYALFAFVALFGIGVFLSLTFLGNLSVPYYSQLSLIAWLNVLLLILNVILPETVYYTWNISIVFFFLFALLAIYIGIQRIAQKKIKNLHYWVILSFVFSILLISLKSSNPVLFKIKALLLGITSFSIVYLLVKQTILLVKHKRLSTK
jgi:hypothetical protein